MTCFSWMLTLVAAVLVMVSLIRWFEQVTEAVERRWWNKVLILVAAPFTVWFFPSKVAAGRPTAVPRHEPVRGFGSVSITPHGPSGATAPATDAPPAGTPKEFIGLPKVPPPKPRGAKPPIDPEKIARLKQKLREQGMIEEEQ